MAIPVLPWLAVWLLAFLTYRQRELLQAGLAGAALLLGLAGFGYWLYLSRRSMQRSSAKRTREIQAVLGPGVTLHDENAGHFLEVLRRATATLRRRDITFPRSIPCSGSRVGCKVSPNPAAGTAATTAEQCKD